MSSSSHFSANFAADEVEIAPDWRYQFVVPYIRLSSSYLAVRDKFRGLPIDRNDLPADEALVHHVADWFDLLSVESDEDANDQADWWERAGKSLYGFDMPIPHVLGAFLPAGEARVIHAGGRLLPTFHLEVPLNLTITEAMKEIKAVFDTYLKHWGSTIQFGMPLPAEYKAHYKLTSSKLQQETLVKGIEALKLYRAGLPLWKIGNDLVLSPAHAIPIDGTEMDRDEEAHCKRTLSIKARQLIKTASLVAENAARGRFPSDKPFPEAMLDTYSRKAGRPVGSKRPKRINVRSA